MSDMSGNGLGTSAIGSACPGIALANANPIADPIATSHLQRMGIFES
jgi:hypothetical protein